jgi:phenylalanyl-tRNA synthetase beta chain
MTISYKWLLEYLPVEPDPEKLSRILNSIGLEVESLEKYEEVKGGLKGLLVGEVLDVQKHPNADKLSLTKVNTGNGTPLSIVCGAPNVAVGQKVVVAPVGSTIYPVTGDPLTMKLAKIRGEESHGMICAEDEIGLGISHQGIMVLNPATLVGISAAEYFKPYDDYIFEIGLTPNRSDAMSHLGVARDICAYLGHHERKTYSIRTPFNKPFKTEENTVPVTVSVENRQSCPRYSGVGISGIKVGPSPEWLVKKLKAIGVRPINNVVDVTNFILHETGQPLHAFDADMIRGNKIIVKNLPAGTPFVSLDEKERKLSEEDLMICNGNSEPMCIGGVFGGLHSGVSATTTKVFLESAWFDPGSIRRSSFRHNLRTDAATRFEKGVDIGNTVNVLKRAALMIAELSGGRIASEIKDAYPDPVAKKQVSVKYHYIKKLSGKNYHPDTVKKILEGLGFGIDRDTIDELTVSVPLHKTDISLPADIVEEVMRIDGFDNIDIPSVITISPSVDTAGREPVLREKIAGVLTGLGFNEIMNNSITNSAFLDEEEKGVAVKMMNNLSAELDVLRTSMLETGLLTVLHNLNRKNNSLKLFEFGKTYTTTGTGKYQETEHLALFVTGNAREQDWRHKKEEADIFLVKGVVQSLLTQLGIRDAEFMSAGHHKFQELIQVKNGDTIIATIGKVSKGMLNTFDIRQDVFYADILWSACIAISNGLSLSYKEIPRFPAVQRDLAFVVDRTLPYGRVETAATLAGVKKLRNLRLFDVFESEKLGQEKKSMAVSFTFLDEEKTLTDKEVDEMMQKIIVTFEQELQAEIRKG